MAVIGVEFKFKITYPSRNSEVPIGFVFYDPNHVFFPTTFATFTKNCSFTNGAKTVYVSWNVSGQYTDTFTIFNVATDAMSSTDEFASKGVKVAPLYTSDLTSP